MNLKKAENRVKIFTFNSVLLGNGVQKSLWKTSIFKHNFLPINLINF